MRAWSLRATWSVLAAVLLAGCASRHMDAAPARAADNQGNAIVRKVTYFAAWVDERSAAASSRSLAAEPAPARASSDKRATRAARGKTAGKADAPSPSTGSKSATAPAQPRYEYIVELDAGGYRTLTGHRDLGIHVNDRVTVQGDTVASVAN